MLLDKSLLSKDSMLLVAGRGYPDKALISGLFFGDRHRYIMESSLATLSSTDITLGSIIKSPYPMLFPKGLYQQ